MTTRTHTADALLDIPVRHIRPNPNQPRQHFDAASLKELADSIREKGVIQPLVVTPDGSTELAEVGARDRYTLVAGERRLRAAEMAGLESVPCVVKPRIDDRARAELALIENVQREDLTAAEEARAYETLATEFGLSNEDIGKRVGKDRTTIANKRGLLRLPKAVLDQIGPNEGQLPERFARALVPIAKLAPKDVAEAAKGLIQHPDDADYIINGALDRNAIAVDAGWDLNWLKTPVTAKDDGGEIEIRDCAGCSHFARIGRNDLYCANARCYATKLALYGQKEAERVSKKLGIPVAADETVTVLNIDFRNESRVKAWLKAKKRPDPLRIVPRGNRPRIGWAIRDLLGSDAVLLASTDPQCLTRNESVPAKVENETEAQRKKRVEAAEQVRAERREEKAAKRKAQHDIDWLAINTAKLVAPQLTATGMTLEWMAVFVDMHASLDDTWPAVSAASQAIETALETAKGKMREALLREQIVLALIGHHVADRYNPHGWHEDWESALNDVKRLIADKPDGLASEGMGLTLPKGWDKPPIHRTETNCWHCGQFTSNDRIAKRDMEEGWGVVYQGKEVLDVHCPNCTGKAKKAKR